MNNTKEIKSVKINGCGYLLNGNIYTNGDNELIKQWLSEGNIPEPEFTDEELNQQRIASIKAKSGQIINFKYDIYWQLNHPRLDVSYANQYEWIDNIRAISNKAELEGTALEDIDWGIK